MKDYMTYFICLPKDLMISASSCGKKVDLTADIYQNFKIIFIQRLFNPSTNYGCWSIK